MANFEMEHTHNDSSLIKKILRWTKSSLANQRHHSEIRAAQRLDRITIYRLMRLDNNILQDIGLNRNELRWASKLPNSRSAVNELQKIRSKRP